MARDTEKTVNRDEKRLHRRTNVEIDVCKQKQKSGQKKQRDRLLFNEINRQTERYLLPGRKSE